MRGGIALLVLGSLAACAPEGSDRNAPGTQQPTARSLPEVQPRAVQIGFDGPRFDACAGYGRVSRLNPDGDSYLTVRAAPATNSEEVDRLEMGRGVSMCQQVGNWIGIVYSPDPEARTRCGTGSPVPSVRAYEGPCRTGWVNENFVQRVAG